MLEGGHRFRGATQHEQILQLRARRPGPAPGINRWRSSLSAEGCPSPRLRTSTLAQPPDRAVNGSPCSLTVDCTESPLDVRHRLLAPSGSTGMSQAPVDTYVSTPRNISKESLDNHPSHQIESDTTRRKTPMVDTEASLCQVPILGGFRGASSRIPWRGDLDRQPSTCSLASSRRASRSPPACCGR